MPNQHDIDRKNDIRLVTPFLIMALVIIAGVLAAAYAGHPLA